MTGAVNLYFKTIFMPFWPSFAILLVYKFLSLVLIREIWLKKIRLKFWWNKKQLTALVYNTVIVKTCIN
jgi:hypothetical protein